MQSKGREKILTPMTNANMTNKRGLFIFSFRIENKYSKE